MEQDAADVAAALNGDDEAFGRLYDRHAPVVLSLCRQHVPRRSFAEAEDASQETFIRAHRLLERLDDPRKLRPWLYGIARHVCSERRRAASRRAKHEEQARMNAANEVIPAAERAEAQRPIEEAERREQLSMLDGAMDALGDSERLAIHLFYLEADPIKAAATSLGLSRSGYYKLLARAREQLAGLMRERQTS